MYNNKYIPNGYEKEYKKEAIPNAARVSVPSASVGAGPTASDSLLGLGGMADLGLSSAGEFPHFRVFCVFFWMVRRQRHPKVSIRSSLPYPCSGGTPSASGGCVESCVLRIFSYLFGLGNRWCGFRSVSSDLWLSSFAMIAALVRWFFGALARRFSVCLLQQALL
jgi:hypothetical protein